MKLIVNDPSSKMLLEAFSLRCYLDNLNWVIIHHHVPERTAINVILSLTLFPANRLQSQNESNSLEFQRFPFRARFREIFRENLLASLRRRNRAPTWSWMLNVMLRNSRTKRGKCGWHEEPLNWRHVAAGATCSLISIGWAAAAAAERKSGEG